MKLQIYVTMLTSVTPHHVLKMSTVLTMPVPIKVCNTVTWGVQPTNRGQGLRHFFIAIILFSSSLSDLIFKETRKSEPMFSFGIKPETKKGPHCPGIRKGK